jgi:hypothetical protein
MTFASFEPSVTGYCICDLSFATREELRQETIVMFYIGYVLQCIRNWESLDLYAELCNVMTVTLRNS